MFDYIFQCYKLYKAEFQRHQNIDIDALQRQIDDLEQQIAKLKRGMRFAELDPTETLEKIRRSDLYKQNAER